MYVCLPWYWGAICVDLTVYHDLNVCYHGRPMLKTKNLSQNKFKHKTEVATIFTDVTEFDNEKQLPTQATINCAFLRDKSYIIIIIRQPKPVSWFETTFTLEQKSGFKLERNKDLRFIVIIIDIDWYEKKILWCFLPISPSPTPMWKHTHKKKKKIVDLPQKT